MTTTKKKKKKEAEMANITRKLFADTFSEKFFAIINTKNSWGKNEIMSVFLTALTETYSDLLERYEE